MMDKFVAWLAPIAATLVTLAGQLWLNGKFKSAEDKRDAARAETDAKRAAEAEWRNAITERLDGIGKRLDDIEDKQIRSISQQASQIRSDIIHKCHRYLDDLGKASTEEKDALSDEHRQYSKFCDDLDVDNNFIDNLVLRVMDLPERKPDIKHD